MSARSFPRHENTDGRIHTCRHRHEDFRSLAVHVAADFAHIEPHDIVQDLRIAREAVDTVDLGDESLRIAELIARYRLLLRTGEVADGARLDPQPHPGRSAKSGSAAASAPGAG